MPRGAQDSRQAILRAAAAEFATCGFAGAGVDRIARRAGVNKAMIYYHFEDKADLYLEIVREMFTAIRARTGDVAASRLAPSRKLDGFIEAFVAEARLRPHLPLMMMREVAEGGRHLDPDALRIMFGVFANLRAILAEGERARAFKRVDPILMYFALVGPIVMYLAATPVRAAMGQLRRTGLSRAEASALGRHLSASGDVASLGEHLKSSARRALEPEGARGPFRRPAGPRARSRRRPAGRSGELA